HAREGGDFFAAQARRPPSRPRGQADLLGLEPGTARPQEACDREPPIVAEAGDGRPRGTRHNRMSHSLSPARHDDSFETVGRSSSDSRLRSERNDPMSVFQSPLIFSSAGHSLAGRVYRNVDNLVDPQPTVVLTGSWLTVKEQMAHTYAVKLAEQGLTAFTF